MTFKLTTNLASMALLALIAALLGYQSFANRPMTQSQSGPVVTFDLERAINSMDEKKAGTAALPAIAEQLEAEGEKMRQQLEAVQAELEIHAKGSAKYDELEQKLINATGNYRAYVEFGKIKLEAERGRILKRAYRNLVKAAGELAELNGYSLVLVNDSLADIPPGTLEDLNRQISARRIIYSATDITDELIDYMNDEFKKAGSVVPPPAIKTP